jgi:hypothetical protein
MRMEKEAAAEAAAALARQEKAGKDEVASQVVDDVVEFAEPKPKRRFSWLAAALLVLGLLGLGAVSASPYLEPPVSNATGEMEKLIGKYGAKGIEPEHAQVVSIGAGCVAAAALLSLLAGVIAGRFGFASLFLVYLATVGSAVWLFAALATYRADMRNLDKLKSSVAHRRRPASRATPTRR